MNQAVRITSDSTTDLSEELLERYHVSLLPLGVTLGGKEYADGVNITPDAIYEHYRKTGELPKTSATNLSDCEAFFKENTKDGNALVHFSISAEMSSSYNNARLAAQNFDNVYVVDTRNLSTGGGLLVVAACEMANSGMSAEEIAKACTALTNRVEASFVVDDLEFLYKGGRCSALAAFGANLLKLKPCIGVINGKMNVVKKYRGKFEHVLEDYIKDRIGDTSDIEPDRVFVTHAGCSPEVCERCVELVKELGDFKEVFLTRAGCTVSSHCGPNTLGVLFIRKHPINQ